MTQAIQSIITLIWKTPVNFSKGWWQILKGISRQTSHFCKSLGSAWLLLIASLAVILVAGWPWVSYEIQFEQLELYGVRSRFWTFFTFAGFLGLIVSLIQFPYRRSILWFFSALAILAWVAGLIWPSAVHVTFHPDTDYQILYSFWMYPGALALSFLTSFLLPSSAGWDIASAYQSLNRHPEPMP